MDFIVEIVKIGGFNVKDVLKWQFGMKIGVFCMMILILIGCMGQGLVDLFYYLLEKVVELEKLFLEEQKMFEELEVKENQFYDDVMKFNMDDYKKIVVLFNEVLENVSQCEEYLKIENDSIKKLELEFEEVKMFVE